jgi:hypothetical protein
MALISPNFAKPSNESGAMRFIRRVLTILFITTWVFLFYSAVVESVSGASQDTNDARIAATEEHISELKGWRAGERLAVLEAKLDIMEKLGWLIVTSVVGKGLLDWRGTIKMRASLHRINNNLQVVYGQLSAAQREKITPQEAFRAAAGNPPA